MYNACTIMYTHLRSQASQRGIERERERERHIHIERGIEREGRERDRDRDRQSERERQRQREINRVKIYQLPIFHRYL